jgi:helicase required for RNAi-mediated heterochromatin assembly 1
MLQDHNNSISAHPQHSHHTALTIITATMNCLPHEAIVHSYFRDATPKNTDDEWIFNAEIPDAQEMSRPLLPDDPCVPENQVKGNWSSEVDHLTAQYQFLREESTFALRRAIGIVREQPHLSELEHRDTSPGIGIYEKVNAEHSG